MESETRLSNLLEDIESAKDNLQRLWRLQRAFLLPILIRPMFMAETVVFSVIIFHLRIRTKLSLLSKQLSTTDRCPQLWRSHVKQLQRGCLALINAYDPDVWLPKGVGRHMEQYLDKATTLLRLVQEGEKQIRRSTNGEADKANASNEILLKKEPLAEASGSSRSTAKRSAMESGLNALSLLFLLRLLRTHCKIPTLQEAFVEFLREHLVNLAVKFEEEMEKSSQTLPSFRLSSALHNCPWPRSDSKDKARPSPAKRAPPHWRIMVPLLVELIKDMTISKLEGDQQALLPLFRSLAFMLQARKATSQSFRSALSTFILQEATVSMTLTFRRKREVMSHVIVKLLDAVFEHQGMLPDKFACLLLTKLGVIKTVAELYETECQALLKERDKYTGKPSAVQKMCDCSRLLSRLLAAAIHHKEIGTLIQNGQLPLLKLFKSSHSVVAHFIVQCIELPTNDEVLMSLSKPRFHSEGSSVPLISSLDVLNELWMLLSCFATALLPNEELVLAMYHRDCAITMDMPQQVPLNSRQLALTELNCIIRYEIVKTNKQLLSMIRTILHFSDRLMSWHSVGFCCFFNILGKIPEQGSLVLPIRLVDMLSSALEEMDQLDKPYLQQLSDYTIEPGTSADNLTLPLIAFIAEMKFAMTIKGRNNRKFAQLKKKFVRWMPQLIHLLPWVKKLQACEEGQTANLEPLRAFHSWVFGSIASLLTEMRGDESEVAEVLKCYADSLRAELPLALPCRLTFLSIFELMCQQAKGTETELMLGLDQFAEAHLEVALNPIAASCIPVKDDTRILRFLGTYEQRMTAVYAAVNVATVLRKSGLQGTASGIKFEASYTKLDAMLLRYWEYRYKSALCAESSVAQKALGLTPQMSSIEDHQRMLKWDAVVLAYMRRWEGIGELPQEEVQPSIKGLDYILSQMEIADGDLESKLPVELKSMPFTVRGPFASEIVLQLRTHRADLMKRATGDEMEKRQAEEAASRIAAELIAEETEEKSKAAKKRSKAKKKQRKQAVASVASPPVSDEEQRQLDLQNLKDAEQMNGAGLSKAEHQLSDQLGDLQIASDGPAQCPAGILTAETEEESSHDWQAATTRKGKKNAIKSGTQRPPLTIPPSIRSNTAVTSKPANGAVKRPSSSQANDLGSGTASKKASLTPSRLGMLQNSTVPRTLLGAQEKASQAFVPGREPRGWAKEAWQSELRPEASKKEASELTLTDGTAPAGMITPVDSFQGFALESLQAPPSSAVPVPPRRITTGGAGPKDSPDREASARHRTAIKAPPPAAFSRSFHPQTVAQNAVDTSTDFVAGPAQHMQEASRAGGLGDDEPASSQNRSQGGGSASEHEKDAAETDANHKKGLDTPRLIPPPVKDIEHDQKARHQLDRRKASSQFSDYGYRPAPHSSHPVRPSPHSLNNGYAHSSVFSDDEDEEEDGPGSRSGASLADALEVGRSKIRLPPDGRGSLHRHRLESVPQKPAAVTHREADSVDGRSTDGSDDHDWNFEVGQSETMMQIRASSPARRRPMPPRAVLKPVGGGHGWAAPPSVSAPMVPGGGGHGGPRPFKSQSDLAGVPGRLFSSEQLEEFYLCPITQEIMTDPVMAKDGCTYERAAITQWLLKHDTSPLTNEKLSSKELQPNHLAKQFISAIFGSL